MEFNKKFYAANTPGQGGGSQGLTDQFGNPIAPTDRDISNAEKFAEIFRSMGDTLTSIGYKFESEIRQNIEGLDADTKKVVIRYGRDLQGELKRANDTTKELRNTTSDISKKLKTSASIESQIEATKQRQKAIDDIILNIRVNQGELTDKQKELQGDIEKQLQAQLAILSVMLDRTKKFEKTLSTVGTILTGLGKIPFIGGFISQLVNVNQILKGMQDEAAKTDSKLRVWGRGLLELGTSVSVGLLGILAKGFESLIKIVIQFNAKAFEISKNLGISVEKGQELQTIFMKIANTSANAGLTSKEIAESYTQLSNTFGFLAPSSKVFAETTTLIQKRIGASAEQMGALAMQSALSGKFIDKTYGTIQATAKIEGARNKIQLSERQVLDAIARTSSTVLINFKGSAEALTTAVVRATKLGTTLDQVNKQGDSLLDFETSIAKEFEAQVLTGRDLNLTKAREYALMGDTRKLMEELNKQGASYNQFMNMNVIARKAEAEAVGLSVEEYSKILLQQKQAQALGVQQGQSLVERYGQLMKTVEGQKKLKEELSESELIDLRKASIQDKFNAALERFKDILGSTLQGPVSQMLEKFIAFVGNTEKMQNLANKIKSVFEGIASVIGNLPALLKGAVEISKILVSLAAGRMVAQIIAAFAGTGNPFALIAGGLAGAAAYGYINSLTGGLLGGGGNTPDFASAPSNAPGGAGTAMTAPVNPGITPTATTVASTASTASPGAAGTMKEYGDVYLDAEKVGYIVLKGSKRVPGLDKA